MNFRSYRDGIRSGDFLVFLQAIFLGIIIAEIFYISLIITNRILNFINVNSYEIHSFLICTISLIISLAYLLSRDFIFFAKKILISGRLDLLFLLFFGIYISTNMGGLGTKLYKILIEKIDEKMLIIILTTPLIIFSLIIFKAIVLHRKEKLISSFFFSDQEILTREQDLLGLAEQANRFAERVLNGGSSDSLVFGIDAPWGTGKSSFINFCCEYWSEKLNNRIIVHRFEPLRYNDSDDLSKKFINDLITTIQDKVFAPTLRSLFTKYFLLVKGKAKISLLGIDFEYDPMSETVESTLDEIDITLQELNRKIIVVVDDLDRLSWSGVKNILYAIKRSFRLSNVTYILCYDTENFSIDTTKSDDLEKVVEFLEKFVNVKISLFLDPKDLKRYVSENFSNAASFNLSMDPYTADKVKETVEELLKIYDSNDYISYKSVTGDIRKIKRLINTLMLLEIDKTDFYNSDYDKGDLLHLLLIYINYPNIFRKIYDSECNGKSGSFSLRSNFSNGSTKWTNSEFYSEYIKNISVTKKFLLNKVFPVVNEPGIQNILEPELRSRARFNETYSGRSLEKYLNLIIKLSKQNKRESYQFYINNKNLLIDGYALDKIFQDTEFSFSAGDASRDELWRIIINSCSELSAEQAGNIIIYLADHLPEYTHLEFNNIGVGSRRRLIYSLLKLLDTSGWGTGNRRNNHPSEIAEIAEWIFGEGRHKNHGLLKKLVDEKRGALGFYDILLFRLSCSADRGVSLYNLQRALAYHGNESAQVTGITTELAKEEMREISQKIFSFFKTRFIIKKINIFDEIDNISTIDFFGGNLNYINSNISKKILEEEILNSVVISEKSTMKSFVIYQLSNSIIDSGVGCGFYDEDGIADNKGIAEVMNDYLFNFCFNPNIESINAQKFIDFLILQFTHTFGYGDGVSYIPTTSGFTKALDKGNLITYWTTHRNEIKGMSLELMDKKVVCGSYIASYQEDVLPLFSVLDTLIDE